MAANAFLMSFLFICSLFILKFSLLEAQLVPAVFVFGDSLVDVGNNNYIPSVLRANFPHNGIDFPNKKATGRFSNGKNAADFIAEKVGLPTSPPYLSLKSNKTNGSLKSNKTNGSFLTGVNFASGGSGIFNNGSDEFLKETIPLTKQVDYFSVVQKDLIQQIGSSSAQTRLAKSIFVVVIGSNDLFGYSESSDLQKKNTPQQFIKLMVVTLRGQLQRLHTYGARKFVITGIGGLGCAPSKRRDNKNQDCNELLNSWAVEYNQELKTMLKQLQSELQGMHYSYFDTFNVFQNMIQKPSNYGFTEVKAACCGLGKLNADVPCTPVSKYCPNRRDHLFWDMVHPTQAAASILVDTMFDGPLIYTSPINVRQLISV